MTASGIGLSVAASCAGGETAVSGGFSLSSTYGNNSSVVASQPVINAAGTPTGWTVTQRTATPMTVYVTCIQ